MNTTVENNKLIAEFMKFEQYPIKNRNNGYIVDFKNGFVPYKVSSASLRFDTDWNWLMEAVLKILELQTVCAEKRQNIFNCINPDKQITYNAVVEFIKWYNSAQKESK